MSSIQDQIKHSFENLHTNLFVLGVDLKKEKSRDRLQPVHKVLTDTEEKISRIIEDDKK
jgi:hypothetical protein